MEILPHRLKKRRASNVPFRREIWNDDILRWLYISIVIVSACVMAVLFVLILNDKHDITREANIRATQIQQQRYDATFQNCLDTNERHDETIRRLNTLLRQAIKDGQTTVTDAQRSAATTTLLIDALVPKRNCIVVAHAAVHPLENPNGR